MIYDWAPCKFIDYSEYLDEDDITFQYGLTFEAFDDTKEYLQSQGFMAGGYTWHGIVESMIRMESPELASEFAYAPEASMLCVRSSNMEALRTVLSCIRRATTDQAILFDAIENADESIIE